MKDEIYPLTSLRMVAALLVLVYHLPVFGAPHHEKTNDLLRLIVFEGHVGVIIFFVLSGFLITLRYLPALQEGQFSLSDYAIKRFARIYPLYFAVVAFSFLQLERPMFTLDALPYWSLTQSFFSAYRYEIVQVSWSLTVEECFYLLAPLLFLSLISAQKRFSLAWRGMLIALIGWVIGLALLGWLLVEFSIRSGLAVPAGFMNSHYDIFYFTIFGNMFHFAVGAGFGLFYHRYHDQLWKDRNWLGTLLCVIAIIGMLLVMFLFNQTRGDASWKLFLNYPTALVSGLLILALTCPNTVFARLLSLQAFVYLGRVSYALYLLHLAPAIYWLPGALRLEHPAYFTALVIGMIGSSILAYELIEKPSRSIILWLVQRGVHKKSSQTALAS